MLKLQKQPFRGVLWKRCFENMQQIYRKTLYWNRTSAWVFCCKFAAYFQNTFSPEHLLMAASETNLKMLNKRFKYCQDDIMMLLCVHNRFSFSYQFYNVSMLCYYIPIQFFWTENEIHCLCQNCQTNCLRQT